MPVSVRAPTLASPPRSLLALATFALVTFGAAAIGSAVTTASLDPWYAALEKPSWAPPGALIGAMWTVLYALMAVAAWLVWRRGGVRANRVELSLFGVQLALNVLWSVLFFGLRSPGAAFAGILVLLVAVAATLFAFGRVTRLAGALLVPYLAWVAFASSLNFLIWRLNA